MRAGAIEASPEGVLSMKKGSAFLPLSLVAAVLFTGAAAFPARANDSAASIVAGGIVLEENEAVRLLREDLFLSPSRIEVAYEFENVTEEDAALTIAFPFPDTFADDIGEQWPPAPEKVRFIDFTTTFDGKPAEAREVVEIISLEGENITALFREEGWPLAPYDDLWQPSTWYGDEARTAPIKERMAELGLLGNFESRKWKTRITYLWEAVFPAGEKVEVRHSYKPVAGAFMLSFMRNWQEAEKLDAFDSWFRERYCLGDEEFTALAALPEEERYSHFAREVGYVLTSGANWNGPIGHFHLTIDTGAPGAVFASCWPHPLEQTGPQRLEFSANNFTPEEDIIFMTYSPHLEME